METRYAPALLGLNRAKSTRSIDSPSSPNPTNKLTLINYSTPPKVTGQSVSMSYKPGYVTQDGEVVIGRARGESIPSVEAIVDTTSSVVPYVHARNSDTMTGLVDTGCPAINDQRGQRNDTTHVDRIEHTAK